MELPTRHAIAFGAVPAILAILTVLAGTHPTRAEGDTVYIDRLPHIHGLAVDGSEPMRVVLATHEGLFTVGPDALATRVSDIRADLMSFDAYPGEPRRLYASGHPPAGGNLGFIASEDGGQTWRKLADGVDGPVDFHALTVSRADPEVIYGVYGGLQQSRDGGRTWQLVSKRLPEQTFALEASGRDADTLYAGTRAGVQVSRDGGRSWQAVAGIRGPTSMLYVSSRGLLYAFVYRVGLFVAEEEDLAWRPVSKHFLDRALLHMAEHPTAPTRLFAVADTGAVMVSRNGGQTWISLEGADNATTETIEAGRKLYAETCQGCHGERGVGERPDDIHGQDDFGFVAPPLNDVSHGWHHPDWQLVQTILEGSARNPRMAPHKEVLSKAQAYDIVAYIKSLWNFRSLACQGGRHMACMRQQ
jgi:mono/diheme cytochrome c family protein